MLRHTFSADEIIRVDDYEKMCRPADGLHYCPLEHIHEWFEKMESATPYTLVSACSDFCIRLQAKHHPNQDLQRLGARVPWQKIEEDRTQYAGIQLGPACNKSKCVLDHKYSVKMDAFTESTFDSVPANITKWFCTNLDVRHPNIEWIPFGVNNQGHGADVLPNHMGQEKRYLLYVNIQNNSVARVMLNNAFAQCTWATYRQPASLPVEKYFDDIATHKFTLCPAGNGLDCYRMYEAIYLGSVPVMETTTFSRYLYEAGLPVLLVKSFYDLTPAMLEDTYETMKSTAFNFDKVSLSYWKKRLAEV